MTKVREVMSTRVPRADSSDTILEACNIMNREGSSGVVIFHGKSVLGMVTDRILLRNFLPLNKRPDEVKVKDVMIPLLNINADASTKDAAKKILDSGLTRLGVFDGNKFLGWVTLRDLAREISKRNLLDALLSRDEPVVNYVLCPRCKKRFMEKITSEEGIILAWECPNCKHQI
jgi:CBS domain-containing protein/DNA-directed RNA polymerase subunit RPC12/RpoP